ncbi:MAG: hypothetical protein AAF804_11230 [Bacteroidota bacterium]
MYHHSNLGHIRFGKDDGFEVKACEGCLKAFRGAESRQRLYRALQLRQESIRLFPGSEIMTMLTLDLEGHQYRLVLLYRYALDQYQRDGYRAVGLAFKDSWTEASLLLDELRHLAELDQHHPKPDRAFQPNLATYPLPSTESPGRRNLPLFIPMQEGSTAEKKALIEAWHHDLVQNYRSIWASASDEVRRSVDPANLVCWEQNPFWHQVIRPVELPKKPTSERRVNLSEVPEDSLIHAVEEEEMDTWIQKPPKPKAPRKKRFFVSWFGMLFV